jgi:hypothetical protein
MPRHPARLAALMLPLMLVHGQEPATVRLTRPLAEFPDTFDQLNSVMELRDGRVLATDFAGPTVQLVDFARGSRSTLGRKGAGPNEYMMPDRPLLSAGDTILVADVGQSRFLRVTPDGRVAGSFAFPAAAAMSGQFHGADRQGRLYYLGSRYGEERGVGQRRAKSADDMFAGVSDSAPLLRWDRARDRIDTLARLHLAPLAKPGSGGAAGHQIIMSRPQPFGAEDDWAVLPDGRVAILRVADYHVDWIAPDGRRTATAANAFRREPVTRADKDRILKPVQAMLSGGAKFTVAAPKESDFVWPDAKPPFVAHFTLVTPEGRIWVQRSVAEGAEPLYDELDERGRVVRRYVLPKDAKVVGFGKGTVYVTHADEDDLLHLQRFQR